MLAGDGQIVAILTEGEIIIRPFILAWESQKACVFILHDPALRSTQDAAGRFVLEFELGKVSLYLLVLHENLANEQMILFGQEDLISYDVFKLFEIGIDHFPCLGLDQFLEFFVVEIWTELCLGAILLLFEIVNNKSVVL